MLPISTAPPRRSTVPPVTRPIGLGFSDDNASLFTVAYTYFGDANLDGVVGTNDFTAMAHHFGKTSQEWVEWRF